jgi:hypothetical protein
MNDDELLTTFRSDVRLPDEATARQIYGRATSGRRRLPRRRLMLAVAVVGAAALAAGLSATLGGASPDAESSARQQVVDLAVNQVRTAFGDRLVVSAQLYGARLDVKLTDDHPPASVVGEFEARILAGVADRELHGNGMAGIDAVQAGDGALYGDGVRLPPDLSPLPEQACDVPPDAVPADAAVTEARNVALLDGFCVFRLKASDLTAFAARAPVTTAALPEMTNDRPHLIEVYDDTGTLRLVQWWSPFTGAEPGDTGPLGQGQGGSWAQPPLCDPFSFGGSATCG